MTTSRKTIAVDFDGVIHSYISGWQGEVNIHDPATPGAIEFLRRAVDRFEVKIYSTRAKSEPARQAMRAYLLKAGADDALLDAIEITNEKPPAVVYIDDRGHAFDGSWPDLDDLAAFEPWNRRKTLALHPTPNDLDHAVAILLVTTDDADTWANMPRDQAITAAHQSLGRTIRNHWGLWSNEGALYAWMTTHGFRHPDDMSHVVLAAAWDFHNGCRTDLVALRLMFDAHWAKMAEDHSTKAPG